MGQSVILPGRPDYGNLTDDELDAMEQAYLDDFDGDSVLNALYNENVTIQPRFNRSTPPSSACHPRQEFKNALEDHGFLGTRAALGRPSEYFDCTTDIHPFRLENFDTTLLGAESTEQAWKAMRPALALIPRLLEALEAKKAFWFRLAIEDDFSYVNSLLLYMSDPIKFYWMSNTGEHGEDGGCTYRALGFALMGLGTTLPQQVFAREDADGAARRSLSFYRPRVGLSTQFLYHLLSPNSLLYESGGKWNCDNIRFQLFLADLIGHELCQAIHQEHSDPGPDPRVFLQDGMAEVGFSWNFFFAGAKTWMDIEPEYIGALETRTWDHLFTMSGLCGIADMEWMKGWWRKEAWGRKGEKFRTCHQWGMATTATGNPGPEFFIAHRWVEVDDLNTACAWSTFTKDLYQNGWVLSTGRRDIAIGEDGPTGKAVEEWFAGVRAQEAKEAYIYGFPKQYISGPKGVYGEEKKCDCDNCKRKELEKQEEILADVQYLFV